MVHDVTLFRRQSGFSSRDLRNRFRAGVTNRRTDRLIPSFVTLKYGCLFSVYSKHRRRPLKAKQRKSFEKAEPAEAAWNVGGLPSTVPRLPIRAIYSTAIFTSLQVLQEIVCKLISVYFTQIHYNNNLYSSENDSRKKEKQTNTNMHALL